MRVRRLGLFLVLSGLMQAPACRPATDVCPPCSPAAPFAPTSGSGTPPATAPAPAPAPGAAGSAPDPTAPAEPAPRPAEPASDPSVHWKLAFQRAGDLFVARGDGSDPRRVAEQADYPTWSSDGEHLAYVRAGEIWVANADGSKPRRVTRLGAGEAAIVGLSWNSDDDTLAFAMVEHFEVKPELTVVHPGREAQDFSIDTPTLFEVAAAQHDVQKPTVLFDLSDHGAAASFSRHEAPAWSSSGRRLAFARNGDVWLAEVSGIARADEWEGEGRPLDIYRLAATAEYDSPTWHASRENYLVTHLAWAPDENALVYGIQRVSGSGFQEIHVLVLEHRRDYRAKVVEDRMLDDGMEPTVSPDGRLVAYSYGGDLYALPLAGGVRTMLVSGAYQPAWWGAVISPERAEQDSDD